MLRSKSVLTLGAGHKCHYGLHLVDVILVKHVGNVAEWTYKLTSYSIQIFVLFEPPSKAMTRMSLYNSYSL